MLRKFLQNAKGNVSMTFALLAVPIVVASGATVDFSAASNQRFRAQDALDRATLAATKELGTVPNSTIETKLRTYYADFYKPPSGTTTSITGVTFDNDKGQVTATADVNTKTSFLPLASINDLTSHLSSQVAIGNTDFDVVLVLDTTGSMAGSKISTLQTAAKNLIDTLLTMNTQSSITDLVQVGVVPFAAAVNVGSSYGPTYSGTTRTSNGTGAAWLDVDTRSPIHTENWNSGLGDNRFDLFAALQASYPSKASQLGWGGCVESRPYPYSVHDTTVSTGDPKSWFVPMFAPDEPNYYTTSTGKWTSPSSYNYSTFSNSYLDDNGGACSSAVSYNSLSGVQDAQGRTCKYKNQSKFSKSSFDGTVGPNLSCTSQPILPMTRDKTSLYSKIDALTASGNTNIHEGVMWGWRVLSPDAPFTEGRTATLARPLKRVMIVMTDGENTYTTNSNFNASTYAGYGYVAENRLGTTSNNSATVKQKQDALTAEACANAKAEGGITIYTVGFTVTATDTLAMLKTCATTSDYFFQASDNAALLAAFNSIAKSITQLRVAQ